MIINMGKILLGTEAVQCPRCGRVNLLEITSDIPIEDFLTCGECGFRDVMDFAPILRKYGLYQGMSKTEKRDFGKHLQQDIAKI